MSRALDFKVRFYVLAMAAVAAFSTWYVHDLRTALIVLVGIPAVVEVASCIERVARRRARIVFDLRGCEGWPYIDAARSGAGVSMLLVAILLAGWTWLEHNVVRASVAGAALYILLITTLAVGKRRGK